MKQIYWLAGSSILVSPSLEANSPTRSSKSMVQWTLSIECQSPLYPLVELNVAVSLWMRRLSSSNNAEDSEAPPNRIVPSAVMPDSPRVNPPPVRTPEHPNGNVLGADRHARLPRLEQDGNTFTLRLRNWRRPRRLPVREHLGQPLRAVGKQDKPVTLRVGRPEVELAAPLQSTSIEGEVFIKRARAAVDGVSTVRGLRPETSAGRPSHDARSRGQQIS